MGKQGGGRMRLKSRLRRHTVRLRGLQGRISILCSLALGLSGCTYHLAQIQEPGRAVAFTTAGPWQSMIYAAKTDSGTILVDLGWVGAVGKLRGKLRGIGAA